jgi:hypothetical protein
MSSKIFCHAATKSFKSVTFIHVLWLLPNGHQDDEDSLFVSLEDSVEKVVSPPRKGSFSGGAVDGDDDGVAAGAENGLPDPGPPILGNNPPAVGGAVGSIACWASISSGLGAAKAFVNMIPIPSINANKTPPTTAA